MTLVLDASVAIKLYAAEGDSHLALEWMSRNDAFAVPDIFLVEVAQALLRHVREERLTRNDLDEALGELEELVDEVVPSSMLIRRALDLAQSMQHGLHDSLYLALAELRQSPLLTADITLSRKAKQMGVGIPILLLTDRIHG